MARREEASSIDLIYLFRKEVKFSIKNLGTAALLDLFKSCLKNRLNLIQNQKSVCGNFMGTFSADSSSRTLCIGDFASFIY